MYDHGRLLGGLSFDRKNIYILHRNSKYEDIMVTFKKTYLGVL